MRRFVREIRIEGDVAFVDLDKGLVATIDAADVALVEPYTWHAARVGSHTYAMTGVVRDRRQRLMNMHEAILGRQRRGERVFHLNGDLDYRRASLQAGARKSPRSRAPISPCEPQQSGAKRAIRVEGDIAFVPLTKGYEAIIDAEDVPAIQNYTWSAVVSGGKAHAVTHIGEKFVYLRRLIAKPPKGRKMKSGLDTLDCRKASLGVSGPLCEIKQRRNIPDRDRNPVGRPRSKVQVTPRNPGFEIAKAA